ncbi:MAG: uracil-DNA glycosylase [Gammaproteobacteria bacterium]
MSAAAEAEIQRQKLALGAMGIELWQKRSQAPTIESQQLTATPAQQQILSGRLEELRQGVSACTRCELHKSRTQTVFGTGNPEADWLIIGEAPGVDEDRQGQPFVGRAGLLLNEMLRAVGLQRDAVYIANILKCRPPDNRNPSGAEADACSSWLEQQIAAIEPRLILAVGKVAAQNLLGNDEAIGRMRGQVYSYGEKDIPVVVTYHPAYLLRSPGEKHKSWADLVFARKVLEGVA